MDSSSIKADFDRRKELKCFFYRPKWAASSQVDSDADARKQQEKIGAYTPERGFFFRLRHTEFG